MQITQSIDLNLSIDGIPPQLHMPQGDGGRILLRQGRAGRQQDRQAGERSAHRHSARAASRTFSGSMRMVSRSTS